MLALDQSRFHFTEKDNTYVAEASDLGSAFRGRQIPMDLVIEGHEFHYHHTDTSGGDIAGWWWHTKNNEYKLLVIND